MIELMMGIAIFLGFFLPDVHGVRETVHRVQCQNHLMPMGLTRGYDIQPRRATDLLRVATTLAEDRTINDKDF